MPPLTMIKALDRFAPRHLLPLLLSLLLAATAPSLEAAPAESVSWSIGNEDSAQDGNQGAGPVTFTWKFSQPVEHGVYLDGTPWVVWQQGLQLVAVTPARSQESMPDVGEATRDNAVIDATCINPLENELPLDSRMEDDSGKGPWQGGEKTWNGESIAVNPGDSIVTGRSRRDARTAGRHMLFTAIGVCNIVEKPMTGHYRPPLRMPAELRAKLEMPREVPVAGLPTFDLADAQDWSGSAVQLRMSQGVASLPDADMLMNGPMGHLGVHSHVWYETSNGMLNHDLSGTNQGAYHRDVSNRIAICLYTAFDPQVDAEKRQRSLNKVIQNGLDYYYMSALGYPIWNGGGGHPNGIEGFVTITGALLKDARITDDMKFQRFSGASVGKPELVTDMLSGYNGSFSRSEATHIVTPAPWKSGDLILREIGTGAETIQDCLIRFDFAAEDHVLNTRDVPYTSLEDLPGEGATVISVSPDFHWPVHAENRATEQRRSFRFLTGTVLRLEGDAQVRKVIGFRESPTEKWTEKSWMAAGGQGGYVLVYPALSGAESQRLARGGKFTMGLSTRSEAERGVVALWESWPVDARERVIKNYFASPEQDYLGIKLGDHFQWLPFYNLLDDPGAPGKKLNEESATYLQVKRFTSMLRDSGQNFWDDFVKDSNVPSTPTVQALVRHYLLDGKMSEGPYITYGRDEEMWTD